MTNTQSMSEAATSTDVTPSPPRGVAAAKVFDIPELLENILLHVAAHSHTLRTRMRGNTVYMTPSHPRGYPWRPALCLFAMRRVSKTFKGVIDGSINIRQLMFLGPIDLQKVHPKLHDKHFPKHRLLSWFLDYMGFEDVMFEPDDAIWHLGHGKVDKGTKDIILCCQFYKEWDDANFDYDPEKVEAMGKKLTKYAEASWRSIKLCNTIDAEPAHFRLSSIEPMLHVFFQEELDDGIVFRAEATLGEVFDRLWGMREKMKDVQKEHAIYTPEGPVAPNKLHIRPKVKK